MKTLYIFLTRSGTLLSNLVYSLTGAQYTHISLAFDEDLSTLYSSTRKNGYTMFPAGPSREYLNRGVFLMRENIPCALYALEVTDEAYTRAKRRTQHMMHHGELYRFNSLGLLLCWMHIRWQRRRHYFCSQFVSEVLQKSGALELPKPSTLMHPSDYAKLPELRCLYRGTLADLPQRQSMELGEVEAALRRLPGWQEGCVLLDSARDTLWCFYSGPLEEKQIRAGLKETLPRYMIPEVYARLSEMPRTPTMKLDRNRLRQMMRGREV